MVGVVIHKGGHRLRACQCPTLAGQGGTVAINGQQRLAVGLALAEREGPMDSSELF